MFVHPRSGRSKPVVCVQLWPMSDLADHRPRVRRTWENHQNRGVRKSMKIAKKNIKNIITPRRALADLMRSHHLMRSSVGLKLVQKSLNIGENAKQERAHTGLR